MIKHYVKVALRNLEKQKTLAFINIFGLSVGLTCFILFLLYAVNEFSYDRFHKNAGTIYRVYDWWAYQGKEAREGSEPSGNTPVGPAMKKDFPDVVNFVRTQGGGEHYVQTGSDNVHRIDVSFADPQFFSAFTFPLINSTNNDPLKELNDVVITKEKAIQLFGNIDVVGKQVNIKMDDKYQPFIVRAVAENIPVNSSIQFEILGNLNRILQSDFGRPSIDNWHMTIGIQTFVQLREGSKLAQQPERLSAFRRNYFKDDEEGLLKEGLWDGKSAYPSGYGLQPLRDIHTGVKVDQWAAVDPKNIWILIGIAAGVLIIACINFTTLSIGRSAGRAKEVGVRKVIGSRKKELVYQFLFESVILTIFSAALGLLMAYLLLPWFNQLSGRSLTFSFSNYPELLWFIGGLILLVGILSGSYPALVLSNFKPIEVLKNKIKLAGSNVFTKSLVTFQFVLSIGLIISTAIILQQLNYMHNKNLGFNKENVVMINTDGTDSKKIYPLFRQHLQQNPGVMGITASIGLGAYEGQMGGGFRFNDDKVEGVIVYPVDPGYLQVMGMKLIAGRNFDYGISSDTVSSVIVNESLVKNVLKTTPDKAIGMQFAEGKRKGADNKPPKTIIGVTADFNFEDLKREVRSQLFAQIPDFPPFRFFVRIRPGEPSKTLASLEAAWKKVAPDLPFQYSFVDEKFDRFYEAEQRWSSIVGWAGGISVFLACLGLFGLAALAAVNRTKEIGIRKVMGASVQNIAGLLSKDFVKLVLIALVIASPIAWYFMNNWLQDFAYRIQIGWWIFLLTGIIAVGIAILTISIQTIKAGMMNPVKALRSE